MRDSKDEFFNQIYMGCSSSKECLIELLRARGFLIDRIEDEYFLNEDSFYEDSTDLNNLLVEYHLGNVIKDRIQLDENPDYKRFEAEFDESKRISRESCWIIGQFKRFMVDLEGKQAKTLILEPFIARYVKGLASCGVHLVGSCDGNHPGGKEMFLQYNYAGSDVWTRLLCENILKDFFAIPWTKNCVKIKLPAEHKYQIYHRVNLAGKFLYDNHKAFCSIKEKACCEMKQPDYYLNHSDEEMIGVFKKNATPLLLQWKKSI